MLPDVNDPVFMIPQLILQVDINQDLNMSLVVVIGDMINTLLTYSLMSQAAPGGGKASTLPVTICLPSMFRERKKKKSNGSLISNFDSLISIILTSVPGDVSLQ